MDLEDEFDIEIQDAGFDIEGDDENDDIENIIDVSSRPNSPSPDKAAKDGCQPEQPVEQDHQQNTNQSQNGMDDDDDSTGKRGGTLHEVNHIPVNVGYSSCANAGTSHNGSNVVNNQKEKSANVQEDLEMDDEFDALLSQLIDEKMMNAHHEDSNCVKSKMNEDITSSVSNCVQLFNTTNLPRRSPLKGAYNHETSSFFLSQESVTDVVPLKRTFPGPAGLLPELNSEEIKLLDYAPHPLCHKVSRIIKETSFKAGATKQKGARSNLSGSDRKFMVSKAPWRHLLQALDLNLKDENSLLHILNIQWVRRKLSRLPGSVNVPFLVVVVRDDMEIVSSKEKVSSKTLSCRLMDPSGTIVAAVDPKFVEEFAGKIMPGTAIALRNCGVSKFGKQILLTVTRRNVLYLVTGKKLDDEEEDETPPAGKEYLFCKKEDGLLVMQFSKFYPQQILEEYENILNEIESAYEDNETEFERDTTTDTSMQLYKTVSTTRGNGRDSRANENCAILYESNISNFNVDSLGFDDDDDDELIQALDNVNFLIEEDSF